MKKSLLVLGVAVAALASCTNEEVVNVPENAAIRFSQFVNNQTKAVTPVTDVPDGEYYVIGWRGASSGSYTDEVFTNEVNTTAYYWMANNFYKFSAYYDGGNKIAGATFAQSTDQLVIPDYTVGANDLVAAISNEVQCTDVTGNSAVGLDFKHLLSQVGFTLQANLGAEYTLKITNLKFNAINKSTCTYSASGASWDDTGSSVAKGDYKYGDIDDLADASHYDAAADNYSVSDALLVIPQSVPGTGGAGTRIAVTFTANLKGDGITEAEGITKNFSAFLTVPTDNAWKPGYVYNYTTMLTASQFDENLDEDQQITFAPTITTDWQDGTVGDLGSLDVTNP